jgi:hypothetical protein
MTTKSEILRRLPSFTNDQRLIVKDQGTEDIIEEILKAHKLYKNDYEKICSLFYTGDQVGTAKKIFNYIKNNIKYVIESDYLQLIKAPSAIFAMPSSDCKNYALAINGILDACRREYNMNCELVYRFAAYDGTKIPQHVFAVMITNDGEEVWIDPVLNTFNEDKTPNYYTDKKVKNMALMAMSGFDPYANNANAQNRGMGQFNLPSPPMLNLSNASGLNVAPLSNKPGGLSSLLSSSGGINGLLSGGLAKTALSLLPGGNIAALILPQLEAIFGAKRGAAGTEYGAKKYLEMYPDVRAAGYEPWAHYQENGWREGRYWFENPSVTKEVVDDYLNRYPDVRRSWDNSVLQHYLEYGKSEGRTIALNLTPDQAQQISAATSGGGYVSPGGPMLPGGNGMQQGPGLPGGTPGTQTAGMSPLIILALVGAGAAIFLSKKK